MQGHKRKQQNRKISHIHWVNETHLSYVNLWELERVVYSIANHHTNTMLTLQNNDLRLLRCLIKAQKLPVTSICERSLLRQRKWKKKKFPCFVFVLVTSFLQICLTIREEYPKCQEGYKNHLLANSKNWDLFVTFFFSI